MKKLVISILSLALAATCLASCGSTDDSNKGTDDTKTTQAAKDEKKEIAVGETWEVEGQWKLTVNSVTETKDRNDYSDKNPGAVYMIDYTYENLGYEDDLTDGLYMSFDLGTVVDANKKVGYIYPLTVKKYPQETPVGATCDAECCIGVDNAGDFQVTYSKYDGNGEKHEAVFNMTVS